jgi:hypothetical protein
MARQLPTIPRSISSLNWGQLLFVHWARYSRHVTNNLEMERFWREMLWGCGTIPVFVFFYLAKGAVLYGIIYFCSAFLVLGIGVFNCFFFHFIYHLSRLHHFSKLSNFSKP